MNLDFLHVLNKAIEHINEEKIKKGNAPLSVTRVDCLGDYEEWVDKATKGEVTKSEVLEVLEETTSVLFDIYARRLFYETWKTIPSHKHSKLKAQ